MLLVCDKAIGGDFREATNPFVEPLLSKSKPNTGNTLYYFENQQDINKGASSNKEVSLPSLTAS